MVFTKPLFLKIWTTYGSSNILFHIVDINTFPTMYNLSVWLSGALNLKIEGVCHCANRMDKQQKKGVIPAKQHCQQIIPRDKVKSIYT